MLEVTAGITGFYTGANDISAPDQSFAVQELLQFAKGLGAGKADLVFADTRTLAASATENLDLSGVLTDAFGATLAFVQVVAILVKAHAANVNNVIVGGAASNAFLLLADATDKVVIPPGGAFLLMADAGFGVTPSTGDLLKVANSAGTTGVTYDIVVIGRSA
jgi:hypothetical protein